MAEPHNPTTKVLREGDHWRYTVICNGTGCDGAIIEEGRKASQHEAQTAVTTFTGMHKLGAV